MKRVESTLWAASFLAACVGLGAGCSREEGWRGRAEDLAARAGARLSEMVSRLDDLRDTLAARADSTHVRYADELAALERRRQEIESEWDDAARAGERKWKETSARLEKELAELEKRAEELREHLDDPF